MNMFKVAITVFLTGLLIMIFSASQIVLGLTGNTSPIKIINYENKQSADTSNSNNGILDLLPQDLKERFSEARNATQTTLNLPVNMISDILNYVIYYFLWQFMLTFGYKIASLGILLLNSSKNDKPKNNETL